MAEPQRLEGCELELDVLRIAHGGVAVADLDGRVVFVADTLPGERVRARVIEDRHERFLRADTVAVLEASPDRRPHVWTAASLDRDPVERAGGAEFGHIAPERQRALKTTVLTDALRRTGGLSEEDVAALAPEVRAVPGRSDGTRSRTRIRLHVDRAGRPGPYAARSRHVVPVADLPLAVEPLEALLPRRVPGGAKAVDLVAPSEGEPFLLAGHRAHHDAVVERVGERRFVLDARGFWQVHPAAAAVLSDAVRRAAAGLDPAASHLDLYGGVGLLAAALADAGGPATAVTTVEADGVASRHARDNLADLPAAHAVAARVDAFLDGEQEARPGAVVVLDPPRSGAGAAVVHAIARLEPARVVYVACDPVALARDLRTFAESGWRPARLEAFDLFPNTHHLEAVATLERA
ncbi:class I SAM-dependent RNA methyltransferase [Amnibacterium sp. CER49]|uniref:class I SAM-dependent RNA methyltransferase n=1 Tax=Amnibacterium sp. CER49 TaxID=3039161 RepID=UPI00244831F3|nr:class I SAM-dependent RNA methyltransferase [Amnibacterium sp. CER49]MDH2443099.1 class I SAM-dependent RNA methyltransferase [Amnibacterium sp. CER49]